MSADAEDSGRPELRSYQQTTEEGFEVGAPSITYVFYEYFREIDF